MSGSPNYNSYATADLILPAVGTCVKDGFDIPGFVDCPFCHDAMFVVHDPSGGQWYSCKGCHFTGDSIEIYKKRRKLPDAPSAIRSMVGCSLLSLQPSELSELNIQGYARNVNTDIQLSDFWSRIRKDPVSKPWFQPLMQSMCLWGGWGSRNWNRGLGQFVGASSREEVVEACNDFADMNSFFLQSNTKMFEMLVYASYDVPGRIRALHFDDGEHRISRLFRTRRGGDDSGLMMLDTIGPRSSSILATDDPVYALWLQRVKMFTGQTPLSMVVWDEQTSVSSWNTLSSYEIIFWPSTLNHETLEHARHLPRAKIATRAHHDFNSKRGRQWESVQTMIHKAYEGSRTWPEVMCNHLLSVTPWEACELVTRMKLTRTEEEQISEFATRKQQEKLRRLFGRVTVERTVIVQGHDIIERDTGYWLKGKNGMEQLTDYTVVLQEAVHLASGRDFLCGTFHYKGHCLPFSGEREKIEKGTKKWCTDFLMSGGHGYPVTQSKWSKSLLDIIRGFSSPKMSRGYESVGYCADTKEAVFPLLVVKDGSIKPSNKMFGDISTMPFSDLDMKTSLPPDPTHVVSWLNKDSPAWTTFWAIFSAVAANYLAPAFSTTPAKIGLVGGPAAASRITGDCFAEAYNLQTIEVRGYSRREVDEAVEKCLSQGCTSVLSSPATGVRRSGLQSVLTEPVDTMMKIDRIEAYAYSLAEDWVFIKNDALYADKQPPIHRIKAFRSSRALFPKYIAWLQQNKMALPSANNYHHSVLRSVMTFLKEYYHFDKIPLETKTRRCMVSGPFECRYLSETLIRLVQWLVVLGKLREYNDIKTKVVDVLVDKKDKSVTISLHALREALAKMGITLPDLGRVIQIMSDSDYLHETHNRGMGMSVVVRLSKWNAGRKKLQRLLLKVQKGEQEEEAEGRA